MRTLLVLGLLLAASTPPASAGPQGADTPRDTDQALIALEQRTWEDAKRKDYADIDGLLAGDYVDHFPNGRTLGKAEVMDYLRGVDLLEYSLRDFKVIHLSPDVAMLLYECQARGRENAATSRDEPAGSIAENHASVISVWAKRGGNWQNVFYQETDIK